MSVQSTGPTGIRPAPTRRWPHRCPFGGQIYPLCTLIALAACCDPPPQPLQISPDLADCPAAPVAPAVPPAPRTFNVVVAFSNANALALARTERALAACRANLREVVRLVEHR